MMFLNCITWDRPSLQDRHTTLPLSLLLNFLMSVHLSLVSCFFLYAL